MRSAPAQIFIPPPYEDPLPTATSVASISRTSPPSSVIRNGKGLKAASSASIARSYLKRPVGHLMRLPRSLTRESKPEARTVPNQVPSTRPRSMSRSRAALERLGDHPSRGGGVAHRQSEGPREVVPGAHGDQAERCTGPGDGLEREVRHAVAADGDQRARAGLDGGTRAVRASSAFCPRTVRTEKPAARNAEAAGCAARAPRPRPAVGLTKRVISLVTATDPTTSSGRVIRRRQVTSS